MDDHECWVREKRCWQSIGSTHKHEKVAMKPRVQRCMEYFEISLVDLLVIEFEHASATLDSSSSHFTTINQ